MRRKSLVRFLFWLGFAILLLEVVVLHTNQIPIWIEPLRLETSTTGPYYPRLICRISNPRLTPVRYMAVSDSMVAYEIRDNKGSISQSNHWCTANFSFTLAPQSSKEVWIWTEGTPDQFNASIFYIDTSLLSWISPFFHYAAEKLSTTHVNTNEIPKIELK